MSSQIKVRGFHIDVYQHVNNGRYMEFLEEARWEFMDHTGFAEKIAALGLSQPVAPGEICRHAGMGGNGKDEGTGGKRRRGNCEFHDDDPRSSAAGSPGRQRSKCLV